MMAWKPTHLHFSNGSDRLCGEKFRPWPEKYMSDEFARTLPLCPKCVALREQITGRPVRRAPEPKNTTPLETRKGIFLADYRHSDIKEQQ